MKRALLILALAVAAAAPARAAELRPEETAAFVLGLGTHALTRAFTKDDSNRFRAWAFNLAFTSLTLASIETVRTHQNPDGRVLGAGAIGAALAFGF